MLKSGVLSKVCDAEDFFDAELLTAIATIRQVPSVHRKQWEYAMIVREMDASGALHDRADALGLACESEPAIFHAATKARSVLATDLYAESTVAGR
jgi:hypothetical protein